MSEGNVEQEGVEVEEEVTEGDAGTPVSTIESGEGDDDGGDDDDDEEEDGDDTVD